MTTAHDLHDYAPAAETTGLFRNTPETDDERWLREQLDRINPHRHEMGSPSDTQTLTALVMEMREEIDRLKFREKNCTTENEAMRFAAAWFLQEVRKAIGCDGKKSPAKILEEVKFLTAERDKLREHVKVLLRALEKVDNHPQSTYLIHRIIKAAQKASKEQS